MKELNVKKATVRIGVILLGGLFAAFVASAQQVPNRTNFQGVLTGPNGFPLTGPVDIDIGVWTQLAGGSRLYRELHQNVPLDRGVFDVVIGDGDIVISGSFNESTFDGPSRFLEVAVDAETLSPRQPFDSVSYAFKAETAQTVLPDADLNLSFTDYNTFCNFGNGCPTTVVSSIHNFCALTRYNESPPGTFNRCTVTKNVDGTFTLEANASAAGFLECRMSCF